jgi:hypothetical protein
MAEVKRRTVSPRQDGSYKELWCSICQRPVKKFIAAGGGLGVYYDPVFNGLVLKCTVCIRQEKRERDVHKYITSLD